MNFFPPLFPLPFSLTLALSSYLDCKIHLKMIWHLFVFSIVWCPLKVTIVIIIIISVVLQLLWKRKKWDAFWCCYCKNLIARTHWTIVNFYGTQNHNDWTLNGGSELYNDEKGTLFGDSISKKMISFVNEEREKQHQNGIGDMFVVGVVVHLSNGNLLKIHWSVCVLVSALYVGDAVWLCLFCSIIIIIWSQNRL